MLLCIGRAAFFHTKEGDSMSDTSKMTVEQEMKFIQEKSDKLEKQITGYRTLGKRDTTIPRALRNALKPIRLPRH